MCEPTTIRWEQIHFHTRLQSQRIPLIDHDILVGKIGRNDQPHGICTPERYTFPHTCFGYVKLLSVTSHPRMDLWVSIFGEVLLRWVKIVEEPVQNPDAWAQVNMGSPGLRISR